MTLDVFASVRVNMYMCAHKYTRCTYMQVQHSALSVCSLAGGFLFPNLFEVTFLQTGT